MDPFSPLQDLADYLVYGLFGMQHGDHLAGSLNFFIYDGIKILLLMAFVNYLMAVVRTYLPIEKLRAFLLKRKWYGLDYLLAAAFGAVTPFCSCSSIPFFVGFLGAGIPLGVTFAFLIASPLINEAAVILLAGFFGWKLTLLYVGSGLVVAVLGGLILGRMSAEKHINADILKLTGQPQVHSHGKNPKFNAELLTNWWREAWQLTRKLTPYILIGIGVGAIIHGYVPEALMDNTLKANAWWAVPLATLLAVPMYSNAVGVVPIVQALVAKGVAVGTSFAFMMATVGLSLPEALILKKIMSWRLLASFFGIVAIGIIAIGYLINFMLY